MDAQETFREVASLRLKFQMNNRLRLESLAALSQVFREYNEPITDELLASLVFAVSDELHTNGWMTAGKDYPDSPSVPPSGPGIPPGGPKNVPPSGPKKKPSGRTKKQSSGRTKKRSAG